MAAKESPMADDVSEKPREVKGEWFPKNISLNMGPIRSFGGMYISYVWKTNIQNVLRQSELTPNPQVWGFV